MAKKMHFVNASRADAIVARFCALGKPFTLKTTNGSAQIETAKDRYLIGNTLPMSGLGFVAKVKREAQRINLPKTPFGPGDVRYQQFARLKTGRHEQMCEVDLNKAYWHKA